MIRLVPLPDQKRSAIVVSHERSGTHFLMNSLASCYGYVSDEWIDLDHDVININYFYPPDILRALTRIGSGRSIANIIKSHHQADFFDGQLGRLGERFLIFYIYRDPVPVMTSYWRFLHQWQWMEGPLADDPVEFARAEPCGRLMRYQRRQFPSMLERWEAHVNGWLEAVRNYESATAVRYEDLDRNFEETILELGEHIGQEPDKVQKPPRDMNVIPGGMQDKKVDTDSVRRVCRKMVGGTMSRLGY